MNLNQKQSILNIIEQIKGLDLDNVFITAFPNETDMRNVNIKKYSAIDLKTLIKKTLNSLNSEINSSLGLILPVEQNFNNEYGNINLETSLANIHGYLVNSQLEFVEREIDKLIFYQISFGFWEKSRVKVHPYQENEVRAALDSLQVGKRSLDKLLNNSAVLENKYSIQITGLEQLISEKNKQFEDIRINQGIAAADIEKIKVSVEKGKELQEQIGAIQTNQKDLLQEISTLYQKHKVEFEEFSTKESKFTSDLEDKIVKANEDLKKASTSLDYMVSKEAEIKKLTGYAADGALGSKFDERKNALEQNLIYWIVAVALTSVLSLIWVAVVFSYLKTDMDDKWLTLIVNLAKTSPGFFLLGFVISHYNRERAIQEEYAFKSAVAMTLTAYAEMLENADNVDNDSRQKMLCKAIEQLYNQPRIHVDSSAKVYSFSTKELNESVKGLTEVVKEVRK